VQNILEAATNIFDPLHCFWERRRTQQVVAVGLILVFLFSLAGIEIKRLGFMPPQLAALTPDNHFHSVGLAFSLVLALEVAGLILALPCSITKSVGKQFEILALILVRNSFKELTEFQDVVALEGHVDVALRIGASALAALAVFVLLGVYYRLYRQKTEPKSPVTVYRYVSTKKCVALVLLGLFAGMGGYNGWQGLQGGPLLDFFPDFYAVLIFSDVLLVLISQTFFPAFRAVFRNSGYAVATLLIRLALSAPPLLGAVVGVGSAAFAVGLTYVYNHFHDAYK
jgi:hypothetical protein